MESINITIVSRYINRKDLSIDTLKINRNCFDGKFEESYRDLNKAVENLGYSQRVHNETVNSVVKRKYGDKLRSKRWFTQFRETKFKAIVHNIERSLLSLLQDFYRTRFLYIFMEFFLYSGWRKVKTSNTTPINRWQQPNKRFGAYTMKRPTRFRLYV